MSGLAHAKDRSWPNPVSDIEQAAWSAVDRSASGQQLTLNGRWTRRNLVGSLLGTTVIHSFESLCRSRAKRLFAAATRLGECPLRGRTRAPSLRDAPRADL
jgi:hypothetical protein